MYCFRREAKSFQKDFFLDEYKKKIPTRLGKYNIKATRDDTGTQLFGDFETVDNLFTFSIS